MEVKFLNVNLEIESAESLQPIVDDFGENVSVLHNGEWERGFNIACFEIRGVTFEKDADGVIASFCSLIENFSPESRSIWEKSHSKRFDVGFESGDFPRSYRTEIRAETIEKVSKLGASIVVTIYPKNT